MRKDGAKQHAERAESWHLSDIAFLSSLKESLKQEGLHAT